MVRAIIRHPMETGFRSDPETGEIIPAHYIKLLTVKHNDRTILSCDWSRAVSRNPYLAFQFRGGRPGDTLELAWLDNRDKTDSVKTQIE